MGGAIPPLPQYLYMAFNISTRITLPHFSRILATCMGSPCTYDPTANVRILNSRFVHCSGYSGCDVTSYTTSRYLRMTSLSILPYKVPGSAAASGLHLPYGRMVLTASEMCHACSDTRRSRVRFSTRMTTILTYVSCGSPQPLQISRNHFLPRPSQIIIPGI
jgi:hypothetical protein